MFSIQFHKNIMEIEEKIALNMTAKQLTCVGLAVAIDIPLYLIGKEIVGEDTISWVAIAIGGIFAGIGFYKNNGMTLIEYINVLIENNIKTNPLSIHKPKSVEQAELDALYKEKMQELNALKGENK